MRRGKMENILSNMSDDWKTELYKDLGTPIVQPIGEILGWAVDSVVGLEGNKRRVEYLKKNIPLFANRLTEKISNQKTLNKNPRLDLSVPIIEQMSLKDDKETIGMFAELLAKEFTNEESNMVLPAFVSIVKELTPDEAKIVVSCYGIRAYNSKYLTSDELFAGIPFISTYISIQQPSGRIEHQTLCRIYTPYFDNLNLSNQNDLDVYFENLNMYLDNLSRHSLIQIRHEEIPQFDYDTFFNDQEGYQRMKRNHESLGFDVQFTKEQLHLTSFGGRFVVAVTNEAQRR